MNRRSLLKRAGIGGAVAAATMGPGSAKEISSDDGGDAAGQTCAPFCCETCEDDETCTRCYCYMYCS